MGHGHLGRRNQVSFLALKAGEGARTAMPPVTPARPVSPKLHYPGLGSQGRPLTVLPGDAASASSFFFKK